MKSLVHSPASWKGNVLATCLPVCAALFALAAQAAPVYFTTGFGYPGQGNADGAGPLAQFSNPAGMAIDASSNLYVADFGNHTIRKITPAGFVTTLAGSAGISGSLDANGTNALFSGPQGIAVDGAGNVYVADSGNNTIRKITSSGTVSTFAGNPGLSGSANATGTNALFFKPAGLAFDTATNLYVADYGNHTIRKITPAAVVTTFAGSAGNPGSSDASGTNASFNQPQGIVVDSAGTLYVGDSANNSVRRITSSGAVTTLAGSTNSGFVNATGTSARFYQPQGVALDSSGNIVVADFFNGCLRKVTTGGGASTLAGSTNFGSADGIGVAAHFWGPQGVVGDGDGNIYVADSFNGAIRKVTAAGVVTTIAGAASNGSTDAAGTSARFSLPLGVALDNSGNAYVADTANNTIRLISSGGVVSTFAGMAGIPGSANGTGTNAQFQGPQGTAVDSSGNVYVADTGNHTIRKITPAGAVSTFAGYPGYTNNADGTGINASFYFPQGIAADTNGNIYVSDTGNNTIRKITAGGSVTTFAGIANSPGSTDGTNNIRFNNPTGLAVDAAGNVYVADTFNHTIRKITAAGTASTIAGTAGLWGSADGTNAAARFYQPQGIAVDTLGNIYVSDSGNHTLRLLTAAGTNWVVSTIGGLATISGSSDGLGASARFFQPAGLACNPAGNLIIADSGNNTLRLTAAPLLIYNLAAAARPRSAIITWNTTSNATAQVAYGLTPTYGSLAALDATPTTSHNVLLTGLLTNTIYYFQAISVAGTNILTATGSFVTDDNLIIVSAQAQFSGVWTVGSSAPDRYTNFYEFAATTAGSDTAQAVFRPTITAPGKYDVYIWYSQGNNRSANAPVTVSYQGGSNVVFVNQTNNGGSWQLLASGVNFGAGTNGFVRLGNGTGESTKVVIADAVRWVYDPAQDAPTDGTVPDWWASFYFGTNAINAALDPDADGYSSHGEFVLGTSPVDPGSRFAVRSEPILGGGVEVIFSPFQNGRVYELQSAASITSPAWTTIPNLSVTQNAGGEGVIDNTNSAGTQTFYRLSVRMVP